MARRGLRGVPHLPAGHPSHRLCHWALLKLLARLFLSVQLHRGQLEMLRRAHRTVGEPGRAPCRPPTALPARSAPHPARSLSSQPGTPLVFLSTHQSPLDGPLLAFLLFSQGLGVPRVVVGGQPCSPRLRYGPADTWSIQSTPSRGAGGTRGCGPVRGGCPWCLFAPRRALLSRLGGVFLPSGMGQRPGERDQGLPGAVLAAVGPAQSAEGVKHPPQVLGEGTEG